MKSASLQTQKIKAPIDAQLPYPAGVDPERDAWFTAFFIENHLDYFTHPEHAATPEQIRFIVYTEEDERYYPCSDKMFEAIINRDQSKFIQEKYRVVFNRIQDIVNQQIDDELERNYLSALLKIKYKHETRDCIMIPSRVEKRLMRIFINRTQIEDPCADEKARRNLRVARVLSSKAFLSALNHIDSKDLSASAKTLSGIKELAEYLEIKRLISLSLEKSLWESDGSKKYKKNDYLKLFKRKMIGNGVKPLFEFLGIHSAAGPKKLPRQKKILWLAN